MYWYPVIEHFLAFYWVPYMRLSFRIQESLSLGSWQVSWENADIEGVNIQEIRNVEKYWEKKEYGVREECSGKTYFFV